MNITYVSVIAPVAAFSANHLTGNPGTSVTFTDASTNTPTNWTWVFGDGSATNYTQSPVHTYALPGTYNVSLRAYNSAGADYENKTGYITITGWMPTLTNVPTLTGRKGVNWSWVPTWNESVTSSLYINPPFMNYTNGTIWGVPVDNNTIYAFELNATSVNGTLVRHTFWNITIGSDWSSTFTSTPSTPVHAATTYSYQVLLNESATVTFLFKPAWLNVTHNGTTGNHYINGSVPVSVATYTVNISAYSTIGHQYSYQNYSFSVGLWAATFTSTPPATVKNSTSYYASITLNESAILTAVNLPSWLSMSNNGSAGAHVLTGTAPKGVWNVVIMAQSVDGRLVSYLNYTLSGWDPAPLTTDQMFTIVVFLLLTFLFTILFYRDSKLGFLAGILWIITGMVALFMLSNVLTLITIIPGIYYIIGGIES